MGLFSDIGDLLGGVGAVAGAVAGIDAALQQEKALKAEFGFTSEAAAAREGARREQERINQIALARQRRAVVRESRLQRGEAIQTAATRGALGSSAVQGGIAGAQSETTATRRFLNQAGLASEEASRLLGEASDFETKALEERARAEAAALRAKVISAGSKAAKSGGSLLGSIGKIGGSLLGLA